MTIRRPHIAAFLTLAGLWITPNIGCAQETALSASTILSQTQVTTEAQLKSLAAQKRNPLDWIGGTMWGRTSPLFRTARTAR